jgi:protein required for attachment to host cells
VVVADARMLGLLRQKTDRLAGVELHEHARDLTGFEPVAIHSHLAAVGLLPPAGSASRAMPMR